MDATTPEPTAPKEPPVDYRRQRALVIGIVLALVAVAGTAWFVSRPESEPGCAATAEEAYRDYIHELNTGKPVTSEYLGDPVKVMSVRHDPIPDPVPADKGDGGGLGESSPWRTTARSRSPSPTVTTAGASATTGSPRTTT